MTDTIAHLPGIADLLKVLHSQDNLDYGMKGYRLKEAFKGFDDVIDDVVLGAVALGLVQPIDEDSWHGDAYLTPQGRDWSEGDRIPAITYAYLVDNQLTTGTLADWAKVWESTQYSDVHLSGVLRTWDNWVGFRPQREQRDGEDDWTNYHFWAAGEIASARIDRRS